MLTPFRWVTFTHAVQQPLAVPDMTQVTSARSLGSTYAIFRGPISNHAKSTGRLDVFGEWTEDVDLLTDDEPRMRLLGTEVPHQAHAFGFDIGPGEDAAQVIQAGRESRHEFGDTKYRRIIYHSVATTRFREFLPPPIANDQNRIQRVEATTDSNDQVIAALVHHIPNAARPAAPDLVYVLPTFRWERQDEGNHRVHIRHGKAVRVWLRRPWFSSGDGEQLGVVLKPGVRLPPIWQHLDEALELSASMLAGRNVRISQQSLMDVRRSAPLEMRRGSQAQAVRSMAGEASSLAANVSVSKQIGSLIGAGIIPPTSEEVAKMLQPYVSSWGAIRWEIGLPEQPPTVADFPRHVGYWPASPWKSYLRASGHRGGRRVCFDSQRKLWYCDIEIDPGETYFPFVRLALARYQPHSVSNAHLSRVVMSDFIQLAPDRTAEVQLSAGNAELTVKGYSGRNIVADLSGKILYMGDLLGFGGGGEGPNTRVRAALERRIPGIPGDLGWERIGGRLSAYPQRLSCHLERTWACLGRWIWAAIDRDHRSGDVPAHPIPGDPPLSTSPVDFLAKAWCTRTSSNYRIRAGKLGLSEDLMLKRLRSTVLIATTCPSLTSVGLAADYLKRLTPPLEANRLYHLHR
jgi:hypothetical protein